VPQLLALGTQRFWMWLSVVCVTERCPQGLLCVREHGGPASLALLCIPPQLLPDCQRLWLPASLSGFTSAGVAALSWAAYLMGPTTAAGSFMAACQSVGAVGWGSGYLFTFISYLAGGGTVAGLGAGGITVGWARFWNADPEERRRLMAQHMWGQAIDRAFPRNQGARA
jgi:hypothetical protein